MQEVSRPLVSSAPLIAPQMCDFQRCLGLAESEAAAREY